MTLHRAVVFLFTVGIVAVLKVFSDNNSLTNNVTLFGKRTERRLQSCTLKKHVHRPVEPIHASGYPGSGNALLDSVVRHLSGILSIGDGNRNAVSEPPPKPYDYITYISHQLAYANYFSKVIMLVRNPMSAIPSLCNFVYETTVLKNEEHRLNIHHQVQAPEEYWIKFRDNRFDQEIVRWKKSIEYWADNYDPSHRLVISYEQLTDEFTGPFITSVLAQFLNKTDTVSTPTLEDIPCVWSAAVQGNEDHLRRQKSYTAKFRLTQLEKMQEVVLDLILKYYNTEFVYLFYTYEESIVRAKERFGVFPKTVKNK